MKNSIKLSPLILFYIKPLFFMTLAVFNVTFDMRAIVYFKLHNLLLTSCDKLL